MKLKLKGILALFVMLFVQLTFAQDKTASGVVTDQAGLPIPGVNVLVKGTKNGTQTDVDGKFKAADAVGKTLLFSFQGMKTVEMAGGSNMKVKMSDDSVKLEGVVVTAFGVKKQKKSLGYATAGVTGKDLMEVTNTNVFESLSGKMAGVDISAPAQVGASSKVVIRGFNSLTAGAGVLYIVDGSPINNNSSSAVGNTRSFDGGNGIGDLDPNNIESMTVLKGAAASALYGSRAGQGVILITTKSGKNKSKISVELNHSTDFSEVSRLPKLQNSYGQGWNGKSWSSWANQPENAASNENGSWGPAFNGEIRPWGSIVDNAQQIKPYVALKNNIKEFFELGNTFTNNVRVSGGGENSNFSLAFTDVNSDGIIPTGADKYNRKTLGISGGITSNKLSFKANVNYVRKNQNAVNTGQGADAGEGNTLTQEVLQIPRDISVVDLQDYTNNPFNTNSNYFSPYTSNPYWSVNENSTFIDGNRFYGNANISYSFNDKLSLTYQAGGDYGTEKVKSFGAIVSYEPDSPQDAGGTNPVVGGVTEITRENIEFDTNLILNYNKPVNDNFTTNSLIGFNSNERVTSLVGAQITNLDIPNFYELSNSSVKPAAFQNDGRRKSFGVFASIETSYKEKIFLTLTGRNDWTSTLPKGANSYFYPSASLSAIVLENNNYFLKLRAAVAQIANDTDIYRTESGLASGNAVLGFGNIFLPIGGVNGYENASNLGNANLKPEITTEVEFGVETTLFKKRVGIDATVYNRKTDGLLFSRPLPTSTGFQSQTGNILDLTNKGIELALTLIPLKTNNFQWDITTTYTKNVSEVTAIEGGVDKINLASNFGITYNAEVGQPLGTFSAFTPLKNEQGQYVVDATSGYFKVNTDEQNIGTSQRDFILGLKNKVSYKNIVLAFGMDWKKGGSMYSYTKRLSHFTGNGIETIYNDRNTFVIPNSVNEVVVAGNVTGYSENSTPVSFESITDYWNPGPNPGIEQGHIIDKTFVRLRDVSLTINAPSKFASKMGITSASFSLYGKNLALWTPKDNPYVDPELSTFGSGLLSEQGEFGTNPAQRSYGASLKLTF